MKTFFKIIVKELKFIISCILFLYFSVTVVAQKGIVWQENSPLEWKDYKGKVPISNMAATTACQIKLDISCFEDVFTYTITAVMMPEKSWVKKNLADDNLLKHERLHFDISELYARKIRAAFANVRTDCHHFEVYDKIMDNLIKEMNIVQQQYDKDTEHGTIYAPHELWYSKIASELNALNEYASKL